MSASNFGVSAENPNDFAVGRGAGGCLCSDYGHPDQGPEFIVFRGPSMESIQCPMAVLCTGCLSTANFRVAEYRQELKAAVGDKHVDVVLAKEDVVEETDEVEGL